MRLSGPALHSWLVLAVVVAPSSVAPAIRSDWSSNEIACASSIGVDLSQATDASSPTFVRHLAWIADLVIHGTVSKIEHDIRGPYPTIVEVELHSTMKGDEPDSPIFVNLRSGPQYSEAYDAIGESILVGEPSFEIGERVILFLTFDWEVIPDDPTRFELDEGHYRLVDSTKWLIEGSSVVFKGNPESSRSIQVMNSEIQLAVSAQSTNCL